MKLHKWKDIRDKKLSPEQVQRLKEEALAELAEMNIKAIREAAGLTQEELAAKVDLSQGQLSKVERGDFNSLPTVRKVVEALGGELEVNVVIRGKRVRLVAA
jgi:predicted transcriptional regulator